MKEVKVKAPAKINLTLEVLDKRQDGFHNIQSIMQAINLYDFLTIKVEDSSENLIELSGTSKDIPYDEKNLVYKAVFKFLEKAKIQNKKISIFIEKNIPIEAGLAGGSTDAAGTFYGLNQIFDIILNEEEINDLCASLGSDLNFCLKGGCALCTSRGEVIESLPSYEFELSLIKPKSFGISAKEAYTKFSDLEDRSNPDNTTKLKNLLLQNKFDKSLLYNSLEVAVIDDYEDLIQIKKSFENSLMSGSGPTFFVLSKEIGKIQDRDRFIIIENLKTIEDGVKIV